MDLLYDRMGDYNENKEEYDVLYKQYFKNVNGKGFEFSPVLSWRKSDWLIFIPYISYAFFGSFFDVYKEILKILIDSRLFVFSNLYDWEYYQFRVWLKTHRHVFKNNYLAVEPFHMSFNLSDNYSKDCLTVPYISHECNLKDVGCGSCVKKMKCLPTMSIHLCKFHHDYLMDIENNNLGLSQVFVLNDGRCIHHLGYIRKLNESVSFETYSNASVCNMNSGLFDPFNMIDENSAEMSEIIDDEL